jgi:hypothetical protein
LRAIAPMAGGVGFVVKGVPLGHNFQAIAQRIFRLYGLGGTRKTKHEQPKHRSNEAVSSQLEISLLILTHPRAKIVNRLQPAWRDWGAPFACTVCMV